MDTDSINFMPKALSNRLEDIDRQLAELNRERRETLELMDPHHPEISTNYQAPLPDFEDNNPPTTDLADLDIDLSEPPRLVRKFYIVCKTYSDLNQPFILSDVARYLVQQRATKAAYAKAKSTLSTAIANDSQHFRQLAPNYFMHFPDGKPDLMTPDDCISEHKFVQ